MTPEQALQNLDRAARTCQATRDEHILFERSVQTLRQVLQERQARLAEMKGEEVTPEEMAADDAPAS